jgi:phage shock protein A
MAELNNSGVNEVNDLERKYGAYTTSEVDDELAALKAKVGQN